MKDNDIETLIDLSNEILELLNSNDTISEGSKDVLRDCIYKFQDACDEAEDAEDVEDPEEGSDEN